MKEISGGLRSVAAVRNWLRRSAALHVLAGAMRRRRRVVLHALAAMIVVFAIGAFAQTPKKIVKSDAEWKKVLTKAQYHVLREKGTERPYTGKYWDNHEQGTYVCITCGQELFSSATKFESGTGWPSFYQPIAKGKVDERTDRSLGMERTELLCSRCGGHLGHVFDDGPKPTGLRYCINSVCLNFKKK